MAELKGLATKAVTAILMRTRPGDLEYAGPIGITL